MKHIFLLFVCCSILFTSISVLAQAKLEKQVEQRDQLLHEWEQSVSKKTGFFGNRTKRDMAETNEWLRRIIAQDNLIIDELKFSFSVESSFISQEKEDYKSITLSLEKNVQALQRAVADRDDQLKIYESEQKTYELLLILLLSGCLVFGYWILKQKNSLSGVKIKV